MSWETREEERPFEQPPARRKAIIVTALTAGAAGALGIVLVVVFIALLVRLFDLVA